MISFEEIKNSPWFPILLFMISLILFIIIGVHVSQIHGDPPPMFGLMIIGIPILGVFFIVTVIWALILFSFKFKKEEGSLRIFKPSIGKIVLTVLVSIWYYLRSLDATFQKCSLICDKTFINYSIFFGKCSQTCSQLESILSLLITLFFVPLVYIIISYIESLRKKKI